MNVYEWPTPNPAPKPIHKCKFTNNEPHFIIIFFFKWSKYNFNVRK